MRLRLDAASSQYGFLSIWLRLDAALSHSAQASAWAIGIPLFLDNRFNGLSSTGKEFLQMR